MTTTASLSIHTLKEEGFLHDAQSYTYEQILDAAARRYVEQNDCDDVDELYEVLSDECDTAAQIALDNFDLTAYCD